MIRSLNAHPVSGGSDDLGSFKLICRLLSEDKKVVIFPEGHRTSDGLLGEVKSGIAMLAFRCHAPIIPVYIGGTFDVWNKMEKLPRLNGHTVCVFGSAIFPEKYESLEKKQAQEAMSKDVKTSIAKLKSWYENGAAGTPP